MSCHISENGMCRLFFSEELGWRTAGGGRDIEQMDASNQI